MNCVNIFNCQKTTVSNTNITLTKYLLEFMTRKCAHPPANRNVDEFVSSSDLEKCPSYGCTAVNGCRQNESPN